MTIADSAGCPAYFTVGTVRPTMTDVQVVAVCGSLREESTTRVALERVLEAAEAGGASTELLDLREFELPTFDADRNRENAGDADELASRLREADAVVLGSPMYHGS